MPNISFLIAQNTGNILFLGYDLQVNLFECVAFFLPAFLGR